MLSPFFRKGLPLIDDGDTRYTYHVFGIWLHNVVEDTGAGAQETLVNISRDVIFMVR